jgi:hypothetical protein
VADGELGEAADEKEKAGCLLFSASDVMSFVSRGGDLSPFRFLPR